MPHNMSTLEFEGEPIKIMWSSTHMAFSGGTLSWFDVMLRERVIKASFWPLHWAIDGLFLECLGPFMLLFTLGWYIAPLEGPKPWSALFVANQHIWGKRINWPTHTYLLKGVKLNHTFSCWAGIFWEPSDMRHITSKRHKLIGVGCDQTLGLWEKFGGSPTLQPPGPHVW